MDEIDMKIVMLLIVNSRLSYREISDHLELSINAVYKRIQTLIDLEIIQKFTARINPYAVNSIYTLVFGESKAKNMSLITKKLGIHENTYNIMLSSRNQIYIGALLRNIHELDDYSSFVSRTAEIQSPTIGLLHGVFYPSPIRYNVPRSRIMNLDKLDIEIIRSLHRDSRKPISEVADDVNSTSNTVRRRLSRMVKEGAIELSINFNPVSSADIFSLLQINLRPSIKKDEYSQQLVDKFKPHIFFVWTFSNIPNFIFCYVWTNTMKELNELIENVRKEKIESIISDIVNQGLFFDTWKEKTLYD
jgi:DNA-binding Lrp family transcriptional regulator